MNVFRTVVGYLMLGSVASAELTVHAEPSEDPELANTLVVRDEARGKKPLLADWPWSTDVSWHLSKDGSLLFVYQDNLLNSDPDSRVVGMVAIVDLVAPSEGGDANAWGKLEELAYTIPQFALSLHEKGGKVEVHKASVPSWEKAP